MNLKASYSISYLLGIISISMVFFTDDAKEISNYSNISLSFFMLGAFLHYLYFSDANLTQEDRDNIVKRVEDLKRKANLTNVDAENNPKIFNKKKVDEYSEGIGNLAIIGIVISAIIALFVYVPFIYILLIIIIILLLFK